MIMPKQGDVIKVAFPFSNLGNSKERPGLVLSPDEYFKRTNEILVMQITSRNSLFRNQYPIKEWKQAGLKKPSWVRYLVLQHIHVSLVVDVLGEFPRDEYAAVVSLLAETIAIV